jgi:biofilm PGA synthesis protein PgaA
VRAAGLYHRVLALEPQHAAAKEGLLKAVREMGAPHLAYELAGKNGAEVDRSIMEQIINDRIAIQIRWGELPALLPGDRYRDTDIALRLLNEAHPGGWQLLDLDDAFVRRLAYDRMVALRDRRRMAEVVEIYEQLVAAGLQAPSYVLMAAADAYLYLEQPELAGDIYRKVLAAEPDHHNAAVSLFFALTDAEAYPAALAHSQALTQRYRPWHRDADGAIVGPDRRKLEADVLDAKAQAFADQLDDAQMRFEGMLALAPGNDDIRAVLANVYRWRGWPRRALQQFEIVHHAQPESVDALLGLGETRMDLRRYRPVAALVANLQTEHPRHKAVQKLARRWEVHNMREFYTRWRWGDSDGPQIGASDLRLDSYLYSSPLDYNYRVFLHDHYARADLNTGEPENHRFGIGIEYAWRDLQFIGELSGGAADNDDAGFGLSGDWRIDDHWTVGAGYESNTNDVPLRAIGADIDSERYALSAAYRWHESQRATLAYNFYSFDDGNRRRAVSGSLQRRLWTGPAYKLDATLWIYASDNTRQNAPYFNPDSDASVSITFNNDWRVWRRYERSFHHNLALSIGNYWQDGFDSGFLWSLSYQHRWKLSDTLALSYGVSRSRRVFDGVPEFENAFFGDLDVRF